VDGERLLCCVLPRGSGLGIEARLYHEMGLTRVDLHSARTVIGSDPKGLFNRVEQDVLLVVVPAEQADEIFDWLYHEGGVGDAPGRFLYMARLATATPFLMPEEFARERT